MPINLVPISQTWLNDSTTISYLSNEMPETDHIIVSKFACMFRDNSPKKDSSETRSRFNRQNNVAKCNTPGGLRLPRMEDFQFGKQHGRQRSDARSPRRFVRLTHTQGRHRSRKSRAAIAIFSGSKSSS